MEAKIKVVLNLCFVLPNTISAKKKLKPDYYG